MTENEKAATFLGWKAGSICSGHRAFCTCGFGHNQPLLIRSPDMTDPRNYMKALQAAAGRIPFVWICIDGNGAGSCHIEACAPEIVHQSAPTIMCEGDDLALEVIKALAALYDAEHPNEKEKE